MRSFCRADLLTAESTAIASFGAAFLIACSSSSSSSVPLPAVTQTVPLPNAGAATVSIDEQRNRVYVGAVNKIFLVDGSNDSVSTSIDLDTGDFGTSPIVDGTTSTLYAANSNGSLSVIDGATLAVTTTLMLAPGGNLTQAVLNPKTHKLYATNYQTAILIVDLTSLTLSRTIAAPNANFLSLNETTNKIYVTGYDTGTVSVLDGATDQIVKTIQVGKPYDENPDGTIVEGSGSGPDGIVVIEATNTIYVANQTDGTFVTIDGATDAVTRTVPATAAGSGLFWVDALRNPPYLAYATNFLDNTLTVFERGGTVAGRVSLGPPAGAASGVAVNSSNGKIYVAEFGDPIQADGGYNSTPDSAVIVLH